MHLGIRFYIPGAPTQTYPPIRLVAPDGEVIEPITPVVPVTSQDEAPTTTTANPNVVATAQPIPMHVPVIVRNTSGVAAVMAPQPVRYPYGGTYQRAGFYTNPTYQVDQSFLSHH